METGKIVKNAPTPVIVSAAAVLVALIASTTVLAVFGRDTSSTMELVKTIMSGLGALAGGGALLYAGSAASSAHTAKEQTNGVMYDKMRAAVRAELAATPAGGSQVVDDESADKGR